MIHVGIIHSLVAHVHLQTYAQYYGPVQAE